MERSTAGTKKWSQKDLNYSSGLSSPGVATPRLISGFYFLYIYLISYIYLKRTWQDLTTNRRMFVDTFYSMWRHKPLKEFSAFSAHTLICLYTLDHPPPYMPFRTWNVETERWRTCCRYATPFKLNGKSWRYMITLNKCAGPSRTALHA